MLRGLTLSTLKAHAQDTAYILRRVHDQLRPNGQKGAFRFVLIADGAATQEQAEAEVAEFLRSSESLPDRCGYS